jgi:serine/threonine protein kinase/Tfp pilus assembly protein PilF
LTAPGPGAILGGSQEHQSRGSAVKCSRCGFENPAETRFCGQCATPLRAAGPTETLVAPIRELETGTTFARRYQIIEELGKGGMGRVYKVYDTEVREKLALKLLKPEIATDADTIERFRNELRLARTVSHRNVCRMHDLGREEATGTYFITMEYVPGDDLKSLIHSIGALPIGKAVAVARQVAEGLGEAHRLGVVHRDLKPQNIMIDREGGARIMDFGIARSVRGKGLTGAGVMIGTPEYMSPEQVDGRETDARSDIYAFGVVLFEMLTGRLPFEGETPLAVAVRQKSEPPPDPRQVNPQVPDDLAKLVLRCLKKEKGERYQSVPDLLADLSRIEKCLPETGGVLPLRRSPTSKQVTVRLPPRRVWIPAAVVLAALAALIVWQLVPDSPGSARTVAVLGFKNQTGDASFDYLREAIPNLLITSLEQSKRLRVTSWERLKDLLKQSGRDPSAAFDEEAGFEICRKAGIEALVVGSYVKAGETFVTDVKVLDVSTRESLKSASARGEGIASILRSQIDEISREIGRGIRKPLLKLEAPAWPIMELTTSSMEAYNYFLRGREDLEKFYFADAKKFLDRAIALDPEFAVAHLVLSQVEDNLNDLPARERALRDAYRYSAKASEKERLMIAVQYARMVEQDPEKTLRISQELARRFPDEKYAQYALAFCYDGQGDPDAAAAAYEKALALDPDFGFAINQLAYNRAKKGRFDEALRLFGRYAAISPGDANPLDSIAELYVRMGQLDRAVAKYREALDLRPDFFGACASLSYVATLQEDYPGAYRWLDELAARAPTASAKTQSEWLKAFMDYLLGRWEAARTRLEEFRRQAAASGAAYYDAAGGWILGYLLRDAGRGEAARGYFRDFLDWGRKERPNDGPFFRSSGAFFDGWLDVAQGRTAEARARLIEMEKELPRLRAEDVKHQTFLCRLLEAEVALAEGDAAAAVAAGRAIVYPDFPSFAIPTLSNYNLPFVKDVLARALWKKGDLDAAAAEYRKLTTIDPANTIRFFISPLYHYRLGRVLEDKGDRAGAAAEYRKFLDYWKDADPSHPEPADARRRLAAL